MSEAPLGVSLEKELELLRNEIGTFKNGVSYIEHAAALIRLAEQSAADLDAKILGKPERIDEILASLQQSGTTARDTAQTLSQLFADLRSESVIVRLDEIKTSLNEKSNEVIKRIDKIHGSLEKKLDSVLDLLQNVKEKASSDSKSIQTQQELYSTKLSLIEERMANQQKSQSVLQLVSAVVGTLTLVVAGILLTKP